MKIDDKFINQLKKLGQTPQEKEDKIDTRMTRLFAFMPKKISGSFIWMRYYVREQEYKLVEKWRDMGYPDPGEKYLEMDWVNINYGRTKLGIEIVR